MVHTSNAFLLWSGRFGPLSVIADLSSLTLLLGTDKVAGCVAYVENALEKA
jgi:hypothetical protein